MAFGGLPHEMPSHFYTPEREAKLPLVLPRALPWAVILRPFMGVLFCFVLFCFLCVSK